MVNGLKRAIRIASAMTLLIACTVSVHAETVSTNQVTDGVDADLTFPDATEELSVVEDLESEFDTEATGVEGFVIRLYNICLDREPDTTGLQDWVNLLTSKKENGTHTAYGFIFSGEFQRKNLCDSDYVEYLYKAFMGRDSDTDGKTYWVDLLKSGMTREEVFNGFAQSNEFKRICGEYGIDVGTSIDIPQYGTVPKGPCSLCGEIDGVTAFVTRMYQICMSRTPDAGGLSDWTERLWAHTSTGADVSYGFIFSNEFVNKNLSDEDFVECMYLAFFGRPSDNQGKVTWLNQMYYEGYEREDVFAGFVNSQEFMTLCNRYGITRGSYNPNKKLTPERVLKMTGTQRWNVISNGSGVSDYYGYWSKELANSMMTKITVPVWDFLNSQATTKVSKTVTLTVNKNLADYFVDALTEVYNSPDQPVIRTSMYCYSYRQNVNNKSVLSNHSYGTAIDINAADNPNGKAMVTADAWAQMPQGTVKEYQKKAYTIYEGCTIYNILYKKYGLYWLGYNRTVDAMHFEF